MKPLHDLVLVQREPKPEATKGSILLPENRVDQSPWVKVLAVGPGRLNDLGVRSKMEVKVGDRAYCRPSVGMRIDPTLGWDSPTLVPMDALEAVDD